jgi:hypothetical protein
VAIGQQAAVFGFRGEEDKQPQRAREAARGERDAGFEPA